MYSILEKFVHKYKNKEIISLMLNIRRIINQRRNSNIDDYIWITSEYRRRLGRDLNLSNPTRFTEKLQWLKLFYRDPIMINCASKIEVRQYLSDMGFEDYLVPIVGYFYNVEDIKFESIPEKCIFKAAHGSSMMLVKKENKKKMPFMWKQIMKTWMNMNISIEGREWPYNFVKPGIICEEFIEPENSNLLDIKFFCFNGKPEFIQVDADLLNNHCIDFYDIFWNRLKLKGQYPNSNVLIEKPQRFKEMYDIATKLSSRFPHVRIDFYLYDNEIKIGELTFFDGSGFYNFNPDEYDYIFGEHLFLPKVNYNYELYNDLLINIQNDI